MLGLHRPTEPYMHTMAMSEKHTVPEQTTALSFNKLARLGKDLWTAHSALEHKTHPKAPAFLASQAKKGLGICVSGFSCGFEKKKNSTHTASTRKVKRVTM